MTLPDDALSPSRRHRRHHRRRRRTRGVIAAAIVIGMLAVTGTALALTGIVDLGDEPEPAPPGGRATSYRELEAPAGVPQPTIACRSPLLPEQPLSLWIGGDSLAGSLGPSLGELAGTTGVAQPVFNSRVSSGLMSPDLYDWPKHAGEDLLRYKPEVVVFIIGANDAKNAPEGADGGVDAEWRTQYATTVDQMMTLLVGDGRTVYWVGAPVMEDGDYADRVEAVNAVFQEVAANHPEVVYVDAYQVFAGPEGTYATHLPNPVGENVRVRAEDGVHFTPEGGDRLADAVFQSLDAQCHLTEQAVAGMTKTTIEVEGSSQIPGTRREGTTVTTTTRPPTSTSAPRSTSPPSTSPPSTSPPTSPPTAPPTSPPSTAPPSTSLPPVG